MGSIKLNLPSLVELPIYAGATTPVPRGGPSLIWSTVERDALLWDGTAWIFAGYNDVQSYYALTDFTTVNYYTSAGVTPEPGTTAFGAVVVFRLPDLQRGRHFWNCIDPTSPTTGWSFSIINGNELRCGYYLGSSSMNITSSYWFSAADVGKIFVANAFLTGNTTNLYVNGAVVGAPRNMSSAWSPGTLPMRLGTHSVFPAARMEILSVATYRGTLTTAGHQTLATHARLTGDIPATLPDVTMTHRWSVKETLLGQDVFVDQTGPASLLDTTTLAPTDSLNRIGAPKVSIIDGRRDGRLMQGVSAFASDYRIESLANKGIRGKATGFWVSFVGQIVGANGSYLVTCATADQKEGWSVYRVSNGGLWVYCGVNASNALLSVSGSVTINVPFIAHIVWDGTTVEFFIEGVSQGKSAAGTYTPAPNTVFTTVGNNISNTFHAVYDAVYGLAGGDYRVTASDIAKNAEAYRRTGRIQPIANKTDHLYDFTADIQAQPDVIVPPSLITSDRVGSHPLYQTGGYILANDGLLNADPAVAGDIANSYYRGSFVASGNNTVYGYPGSATNFWVSFLSYNAGDALPAQGTFIANTDFALAAGFQLCTNGQIVFQARTTTGIVTLNLGNEPIGYTHTLVTYNGSKFDGYINGTLVASTATGQVYTPSTVSPVCIGALGTSYPLLTRTMLGAAVGDFALLAAEITTAALQSRANRKIYAVPNKTTKQWSIVDDIAEAGYTVPNRLKERIGGAGHLGLYTDYKQRRIQTAPGEGLRGGASMWAAWYGVIDSLAASGAIQFINTTGGTPVNGFLVAATGVNATSLTFRCYDADGNQDSTGAVSLDPADVGVPLLLVAVRTSDNLMNLYKWESAVGGISSGRVFTPAPATTGMAIGAAASGVATLATALRTFGVAGSDTHELSAAEVSAYATQVRGAGRIQSIAGKTEHLWVLPQTVTTKGDRYAPAVYQDRMGKDPLYAHFGVGNDWRVATHGDYRGISGAMTYRVMLTRAGLGLPGVATGFWASVMVSMETHHTYPKIFFGQWGSNAGGWFIGAISSTNPRPSVTFYQTATTPVSISVTGGTDMTTTLRPGSIRHIAFSFDGTTIRFYVNGALMETQAVTGYTPYAAGYTAIGGGDLYGTYAASGYAIFGAAGGNAIPTDAEMLTAAQDSFKQNAVVAVPGKTHAHWDFKRDIQEHEGRLPTRFKDRANNTSTMLPTGTYLQTTPHRAKNWAYDNTPTMYGVTSFSATNYLRGYTTDTCQGDPWSFFACVAFIVHSQAGAAGVRTLIASRNGITGYGWAANTGGSNANVSGIVGTAAGDFATPVGTIANTLIGKIQFVSLIYNGVFNRISFAQNAMPVGSSVDPGAGQYFRARTGVPVTLGILSDLATQPATGITILGAAYGDAQWSSLEHRRAYYDLLANEAFPRHSKMTSIWDISSAIRNNNGALPAYIVDDVSGNSLQVVGTPTVDTLYHRSFAT